MDEGPAHSTRLVRILEEDPDVAHRLDDAELPEAARQAVGVLEIVRPGPWAPLGVQAGKLLFGGLMLDGVIMRRLTVGGSTSGELLGAGDVLVPADADDTPPFVDSQTEWVALERARIAWLDAPFAVAVRRWPELAAALLERAQRRSDRLATMRSIAQMTRVDQRVMALLWHLAERWGRITPDGVVLPMHLTHRTVAALVGAQRPSVTTAISRLERRGELGRRADGAWLLGAAQRSAEAPAPASRASATS